MTPEIQPKKVIQLTTKQGLLMVGVLFLAFGGILLWTATRFPQSAEGSVKGTNLSLVPFGCIAERLANNLIIPLREENPPDGFREENRGIVIHDGSTEGTTSVPRPVVIQSISWRDQNQTITQMQCDPVNGNFTVRSKRRGGSRRIREDLWTGTLQATCSAPEIGEIAINLDVKNCD